MTDTTDITMLSDDELGRLIADTALQMAHAQLLLDAALDELSRRLEAQLPDDDGRGCR
jgi:hypothetical protein